MSEQKRFAELENMNEKKQQEFVATAMDEQKQKDFYEKMRSKLQKHIEKHPDSKYINYLVAAPDFFYLLCKLLADNRVPLKNKLYIAAAVLYFTSPLDLITDAFPGIGFADDVIIAVNVINEHWVGEGDVISQLRQLLDLADSVIGQGWLKKIKELFTK